ncbi:MAG TPA: 50S ribosomal protein L4 [Halanaerobiales bacterium]|nr:50S ribosomal protein L4 [Halanaerobiales bacterium]
MPQAVKYNTNGEKVTDIDLSDDIFNSKVNEDVVHQVVTAQLAKVRSGNASTKTRSEVRGGGRKPWRQKGTGRARHGSIRSPLWVGGGITFGPKPRSYNKKVNKKMKRIALKSVLTDKIQNESVMILDEFNMDEIKTKKMASLLEDLNLSDKKVLIILPEKDENIYLSARNLPRVKTLVLDGLNTYDLLNNEVILMSEEAVRKIEEVLGE